MPGCQPAYSASKPSPKGKNSAKGAETGDCSKPTTSGTWRPMRRKRWRSQRARTWSSAYPGLKPFAPWWLYGLTPATAYASYVGALCQGVNVQPLRSPSPTRPLPSPHLQRSPRAHPVAAFREPTPQGHRPHAPRPRGARPRVVGWLRLPSLLCAHDPVFWTWSNCAVACVADRVGASSVGTLQGGWTVSTGSWKRCVQGNPLITCFPSGRLGVASGPSAFDATRFRGAFGAGQPGQGWLGNECWQQGVTGNGDNGPESVWLP